MLNQDQLIKKIFDCSSRSAKQILGGSFHDLHTLAGIKINQQQKEINHLHRQLDELRSEIVVMDAIKREGNYPLSQPSISVGDHAVELLGSD